MIIWKEFKFDSAHSLPLVPEGHKCGRLHGHTWKVRVELEGDITEAGWVMDFGDVKQVMAPILEALDHRCLNDIPGLWNPTSENVARWVWNALDGQLPLRAVEVSETCSSGCRYEGP